MKINPENKISNFITRLPQALQLVGSWEVGLAEFFYPHTWYNVNSTNNFIEYEDPVSKTHFKHVISPGFYPTVQSILDAISVEPFKKKYSFSFNPVTKRVKMKLKGKGNIMLRSGMAELLGFQSMDYGIEAEKESLFVPDPNAFYRVLMLYTDIIEPQIVGDVFAPLLRIINVTGEHGDMMHVQYEKPHYLPVSWKHIETIEINIRTYQGSFVPFERGRSYVKLHFRQKQLQ